MPSFTGLLNNAALMLVLCVLYDTFGIHAITHKKLRSFITGAVVGLIAIVVMLTPWSLQPGVFFDTRWVLLSLCGLFFELEATLLAIVIAGIFRLILGGAGGIVGTVVIIVTAGVGIIWKHVRRRSAGPPGWKELYLFGVVVQLAMLSCMLLMPAHLRMPIIKAIAPPILLIFPFLTLFLGLVLKKQEIRRETDRALEESRKALGRERGLLRGVISSIPDLIFFKDTQGAYLGCNKSFESFAGHTEPELIGKNDFDLFAQDIAEHFLEKDREMFSAGQLKKSEEWVVYPNGQRVLLDTGRSPFHDQDGKLQGLVGIGRDITERKMAEDQLTAERERLHVTLHSIGDGVITTDIEGAVQLINVVGEKLTGWHQEEAFGKSITEIFQIIDEHTRKNCENPVLQAMNSGQIVGLAHHTVLIARDGTEKNIADSAAPIRDAEDNVIGAILVFRDVTDQLRTEQELLKIKKLESIGILAGGIAHDFNNILAAILGNINLVLLDPHLHNESKALLFDAEKASIRARDLARQLLTFSKGGSPIKEVCSLREVINESAGFVLHGGTVSCIYNIPYDLWLVEIDRGQIGQVIQNIVLNAMQAMVDGGTITINCENKIHSSSHPALNGNRAGNSDDRQVQITISDQGSGIAPEFKERIFDPYFSTKKEGSGLGLSIAHSIIRNHGGNITVESNPGRGTTFFIVLPASGQAASELQEIEVKYDHTGQIKVLVMDDDEMVRNMIKGMLSRLGHSVEVACDGEEAIARYQESLDSNCRFDVVLMDLTIPGGMGGKDAVQQILGIDPEAKVIVSSGYSDDPIMANFLDFGFCAAIEKPYRMKDLKTAIGQLFK